MHSFTYIPNTGLRHLQYCSSLVSKYCKVRSPITTGRRLRTTCFRKLYFVSVKVRVNVNRIPLLILLALHSRHDLWYWFWHLHSHMTPAYGPYFFLLPFQCFLLFQWPHESQKTFLLLKTAFYIYLKRNLNGKK